MIKKILNSKVNTIAAAATILGAASLVSHFIGLIREKVLFNLFGAGVELDIYYAAFRIPDFIYSFFIFGVVSAGFVPIFVGYLQKKEKQAWYLANDLLNIFIIILLAVCSLGIIFIPQIIKFVAPGFDPAMLAMAIKLSRIMLLSPFFLGISAIFSGVLQGFKRFLIYSLAPIVYNLGIIFGALVLTKYFGIVGLAYGVALGALCHLVIQLPTAILCGYRWRSIFDLKFSGLRRVLKLMPPRFFSVMAYQVTFWIFTALASLLAVGSIAVFNAAYTIFYFPLGIFALSFAVAALPKLSESAQAGDKKTFVRNFSSITRQIIFFLVPVMFLLIILRIEIVSVILGGGNFSWQDTVLTARTLMFFCFGLFAEGLVLFFLRGFFAWEDTLTPLFAALGAAFIRIASGWYLSKFLGVAGLGLGFAIGSFFFMAVLFVFLRRKVGSLDGKNIFYLSIKVFAAAIVSALMSFVILEILRCKIASDDLLMMFLKGGVSGVIGIALYFFGARALRIKELDLFISSLFRKLSSKKMPQSEIDGLEKR